MSEPHVAVLKALLDGEERSIHRLVELTGLSADAIRRVLVELEEKKHVNVVREKVERWVLTKSGEETIEKGSLPEQRLFELLKKQKMEMGELRGHFPNSQEFSAAFGLAKSTKLIQVESKDGQTFVSLTDSGKETGVDPSLWMGLQKVKLGEMISPTSTVMKELNIRGLVTTKTHTNENTRITTEGNEYLRSYSPGKTSQSQIGVLTPQLLASGAWKESSFKPYDVKAGVEERFPGRIHPLRHVMMDAQRIMV